MAVSLAAELNQGLGIDARLVAGSKGIFDVLLDGELIYSKAQTGRFPLSGDVLATLRGGD
jgi:selT/selW/selH-like putative selenoprotein